MTNLIFTGGLFKVTNEEIILFCRNPAHIKAGEDRHNRKNLLTYSARTIDFNTNIGKATDLDPYPNNYYTEGILCGCSKTLASKNYSGAMSSLVEPERVKAIGHLLATKHSLRDIATYLRYWGYLEITDDQKYIPFNKIPSLNEPFVEIKDIYHIDYFNHPDRKSFLIGKRGFITKGGSISSARDSYKATYMHMYTPYKLPDFKIGDLLPLTENRSHDIKDAGTLRICFIGAETKLIGVPFDDLPSEIV